MKIARNRWGWWPTGRALTEPGGVRACVRACAMSSQVLPAVEALDLRLGGRRVGVRVFASHDSAALALARAVGPLTATSANVCE
jgi:hypothetical protein